MTAFLSIVKLTCRSAIRSNVFRTLLFLLILSVLLVPNTIKGDGTAVGFIQLILEYSLGFVAIILSISAAWCACSEIASDVETGQLHLIAVKPVSRVIILLGKCCGVLFIHGILLLISAVVVYFFVLFQFNKQEFPADEKQRVENEVLCGRRLYKPKRPDMDQLAELELKRRMERASESERAKIAAQLGGDQRREVFEGIKKELSGKMGEVAPREVIFWEYEALPDALNTPFYLRYKVFPSDSSSLNENTTHGSWVLRLMIPKKQIQQGSNEQLKPEDYTEQMYPLQPEELITAATNEFGIQETVARQNGAPLEVLKNMPADLLAQLTQPLVHNGTLRIGYYNFDRTNKTMKFQEADGPFLLVRETGFLNNYIRGLIVIFLGITAIALIASALAAVFTLPTAIFMTVSYGSLCICSSYLLKTFRDYTSKELSFFENLAQWMSHGVTYLLIPFQDFFMTSHLATGQLIEFGTIGTLILQNLILRGFPLFLLGTYLYWRKELALAMKR